MDGKVLGVSGSSGTGAGRGFARLTKWVLAGAFLTVLAGSIAACNSLKPKPKGKFGEACQEDVDCESGDCSDLGNVCTKACTLDKDCAPDLVCRASMTNNACEKKMPTNQDPGGKCRNGGDCNNGICLHYVGKENQDGMCSRYCAASDDCPAGMKICEKISDSGMQKLCLPGDPAAPASARPQVKPAAKAEKKARGGKGKGGHKKK